MKKTTYPLLLSGAFILLVFIFASCNIPIETTPPPPTSLVCYIPVINTLPETKPMQTKGGIEITVTPVQYSTQILIEESIRDVEPPIISLQPTGATRYIEITKRPNISISPNQLKFSILINNLLPRVFRGAGSVVQFNAGGKTLTVGAENYSELSNVIIPPRQQTEVFIYGPALSQMPSEKTNLGVFIFDIVTKVDAAGNILEKQNFEWFFDYSTQRHEESGPPIQVTSGWIR